MFYLFSCLYNVRHKISTYLMMLKTFSYADLFSRPLCWSIYWWMMWFLCGFGYIAKKHHRVYITTVTGISVGSQGKVREFFLPTRWQPWIMQWHFLLLLLILPLTRRGQYTRKSVFFKIDLQIDVFNTSCQIGHRSPKPVIFLKIFMISWYLLGLCKNIIMGMASNDIDTQSAIIKIPIFVMKWELHRSYLPVAHTPCFLTSIFLLVSSPELSKVWLLLFHYSDIMVSRITSNYTVCSTACSDNEENTKTCSFLS